MASTTDTAEQRAATEEHLEEIEEEMDEEFSDADKERAEIIALLYELKKEVAELKAAKTSDSS